MGSKIVGIMQNACVFAVIAQMIFYFRPNASYEKYFKMLMGIFLLAVLFIPILEVFHAADEQDFQQMIKKHETQISDIYQNIYSFDPSNNNLEEEILEKQKDILSTEEIISEFNKQTDSEDKQEGAGIREVEISIGD